jgi:hypothetical protein
LVVAITTGFLSSPNPFQVLALDRPNLLMSHFPMALIPTFAVPLFILLHIASLTKLSWQQREEQHVHSATRLPAGLG